MGENVPIYSYCINIYIHSKNKAIKGTTWRDLLGSEIESPVITGNCCSFWRESYRVNNSKKCVDSLQDNKTLFSNINFVNRCGINIRSCAKQLPNKCQSIVFVTREVYILTRQKDQTAFFWLKDSKQTLQT